MPGIERGAARRVLKNVWAGAEATREKEKGWIHGVGKSPWNFTFGAQWPYEMSFYHLLLDPRTQLVRPFSQICTGKDVLDVMGTAEPFYGNCPDTSRKFVSSARSVTALTLNDPTPLLPEYLYDRRQVVEGDAFSAKTWNDLKRNMRARRIQTFDLIVSRPYAGSAELDVHPSMAEPERCILESLGYGIVRKMYALLSQQGGELFFLHHHLAIRQLALLLERNGIRIQTAPEASTESSQLAVRIEKNPGSPKHLPSLQSSSSPEAVAFVSPSS